MSLRGATAYLTWKGDLLVCIYGAAVVIKTRFWYCVGSATGAESCGTASFFPSESPLKQGYPQAAVQHV